MCKEMGVPLLGKLPLDPRIARACDQGKSFLDEIPDSPATAAYMRLVAPPPPLSLSLSDAGGLPSTTVSGRCLCSLSWMRKNQSWLLLA
jgi:hypothetical protein